MARRRTRGRSLPRPRTTPKAAGAWYERGASRDRVRRDRQLLNRVHPQFEFRPDGDLLLVVGALDYSTPCGIVDRVVAGVALTPGYPTAEPTALDFEQRFAAGLDRHLQSDGVCCLWLPEESRWNPYEYNGIVAFVDQVAVFFHRQLIYDVMGRWVGPERRHGAEGYLDFLIERFGGSDAVLAVAPLLEGHAAPLSGAACPCGSGRRYERCHRALVAEIRKGRSFFMAGEAIRLAAGLGQPGD